MSTWIAFGIALLSPVLSLEHSEDLAMAVGLLNLIALSMVFKSGWWTFWMPLGFWAQRASDSHRAHQMGPVIAFIGWLILLAVLITVWVAVP